MATTTNYELTLLEVGQKEKEVTINENFTALDAVPKYLGDLTAPPTVLTQVPVGSTYYNTTAQTVQVLRDKTGPVWEDVASVGSSTDISVSNSLTFGTAANVYVGASNYGWRDITAEISVKGTGVNNPSWTTFRDGISAYTFSQTTMNEVWLSFHVDHDYAPGTPVFLHVHWAPNTTGSGTVRWGFEYSIAKGHQQQAFPATTTVYIEQASAGQYFHHVAEISTGIAATNIEPDSLILCRVFRDAAHANDTFASPVCVFTADVHHQVGRFATKNKAPNFYS